MNGDRGPLVSVVLTTYDRPDLLVAAVDSVRRQTYDPIELIVVDDHSPTPAADTLANDDRLRIIRHETNRGANAARNTGIEAASGAFIAFLDDDDRWLPEKVERQVERFLANDDVGVVYTGVMERNEDGAVIAKSEPTTSGDVTLDLIQGAVIGGFSRVMVRASVIDEAGRPDERFPSWQDWEWYLRLSEHGEFEAIPDPLVEQTTSATQISDDFDRKRDVSYPLLLEKHRSLAAEYGPLAERQFVASLSHTLGAAGMRNGRYREAARYLFRSLRYWPFSSKTWLFFALALGGAPAYTSAKRLRHYVTRLTVSR